MTTQHKIYIALGLAGVLAIGIVGGSMWSDHRIRKLENAVDAAEHKANDSRQKSDALEQAAGEYKAKIDYLETQLAQVRAEGKKQDEKLQQTHIDTRNARGRVDTARGVRTRPTSVDELCRNLAEVEHPCT